MNKDQAGLSCVEECFTKSGLKDHVRCLEFTPALLVHFSLYNARLAQWASQSPCEPIGRTDRDDTTVTTHIICTAREVPISQLKALKSFSSQNSI
jgi:hypothetical protein